MPKNEAKRKKKHQMDSLGVNSGTGIVVAGTGAAG